MRPIAPLDSSAGEAFERELQVRAFSGVAVYRRVSEAIGLDNKTFFDADGASLRSFHGQDGAHIATQHVHTPRTSPDNAYVPVSLSLAAGRS